MIVRFTVRGTHQGTFEGIAPTGRTATFTGVERHRLVNGKIAAVIWRCFDKLTLWRQLGVVSG